MGKSVQMVKLERKATLLQDKFQLMHDPAYLDRLESACGQNFCESAIHSCGQETRGEKTCIGPPRASPGDALRAKGLDFSE